MVLFSNLNIKKIVIFKRKYFPKEQSAPIKKKIHLTQRKKQFSLFSN